MKRLQHKPPAMPNAIDEVENGQSHASEAERVLDQQQYPVRTEESVIKNQTFTTSGSPTGTAQQLEPGADKHNENLKSFTRLNGQVADKVQDKYSSFTTEDFDYLLQEAEDILNVPYGGFDKAWQDYVEYYQKHSTWDVWRDFFQEKVLPVYRETTAAQKESNRQEQVQDEGLFVDQQHDGVASGLNGLKKRDVGTHEEPTDRTRVLMNGSSNLPSPTHSMAESPGRSNLDSVKSLKVINPLTRKRTRSLESSLQSSRSSPAEKRQRVNYSEIVADEMQEVEESDPEGRNGVISIPKQYTVMPSIIESTHDIGDDQGSVHPSEELGEQALKEGIVDLDMDITLNTTETHRQGKLQESRHSYTPVSELRRQAQTRSLQISSSAEPESSPPVYSDRTISVERDTQAILNAATQAVDFDIPSPLMEREEDEGNEEVRAVRDEETEVVEDQIVEEAVRVAIEGEIEEKVEVEEDLRGEEEQEEEEEEDDDDDKLASRDSLHSPMQVTEPSANAYIDANSANQHNDDDDDDDEEEEDEKEEDEKEEKDMNEDGDEESRYYEKSTAKPQASTRDTQALLAANTQIIDFEVPEPAGGFVDDIGEIDNNDYDSDNSIEPEKINNPASQDNTHTTGIQVSHTAKKYQSPLSLSASELDNQINNFINAGFAESDIVTAMKCTSLDLELTTRILPLLKTHKRTPGDMRGVWTAEDDAMLEGGDGRGIKRVAEKHGWAACDVRLKFLDEWRG